MDKFVIEGGFPLVGEVEISGSKNATLPILAATLLTSEKSVLSNVPKLADVKHMLQLFDEFGVKSTWIKDKVSIDGGQIKNTEARYDIVRKMRATFWVLGPLLARFGHARVSLPGGCAIGSRPVDLHLEGLRKLGAEISIKEGYVEAKAPENGLVGSHVVLDFPSVGATIQIMLAAALAKGVTQIDNSACEPEIASLADVLTQMGAEISGAGSNCIKITGKKELNSFNCEIQPDRIETATWFAVAAATSKIGSDFVIKKVILEQHDSFLNNLEKMGCRVESTKCKVENQDKYFDVKILAPKKLVSVDFKTAPYPGFPTDAQAQLMACLVTSEGSACVEESVFENRFMHTQELIRMGADISIHGNNAVVKGVQQLSGAPVMATDLRASASLIIAALTAKGKTTISRIYHLDRGYVELDKKLRALGARVVRVKE